jgi:hypothetical protein
LSALTTQTGSEVESVRYPYVIQRAATDTDPGLQALRKSRELGLAAVAVEREELETLRDEDVIGADTYLFLQDGRNSHCFATRSAESRKFDDSEHQRARLPRAISCGGVGSVGEFSLSSKTDSIIRLRKNLTFSGELPRSRKIGRTRAFCPYANDLQTHPPAAKFQADSRGLKAGRTIEQ